MTQISKGITFNNGDQLTAATLNQLIDSAVIVSGIITEKPNLIANTVATGDSVLLYDLSATDLRQATASDLFNSNLPVTTSSVTAGANSDITLTTSDGVLVNTGVTYTSANGLNVTATTPTAHGLVVGQIVTTSAASAGYNGTFEITAVTTIAPFTFSYVMTVAATATSVQSSYAYTRQGAVRINEHAVIGGNLYVEGTTLVNTITGQTGTLPISGNATIGGTLNVSGELQVKTIKVQPIFNYWAVNRTPATYSTVTSNPIKWGGSQEPSNLYGTEITQMTLNFTPKAIGNTIILSWNVHGEMNGNSADALWVVTRQVAGGTEEPIKSYTITTPAGVRTATMTGNLSVNDNNDTWSGVTTLVFDSDGATSPSQNVVKIIDAWSSNLYTTYRLRLRMSQNFTQIFSYNRATTSFSALSNEWGCSTAHAMEICEI